jgi:hypothetical protein
MQGETAAMVFTDPPYNVRIDGNVSGLGAIHHREFAMASGELSEAEFTAFLSQACSLLARRSVEGSLHFIYMDWRHMGELLAAGREAYTELKNLWVWTKDNGDWCSSSSTGTRRIATTSSSVNSGATAATSGATPVQTHFLPPNR